MASTTDHIDSNFDESDEMEDFLTWCKLRSEQQSKIHDLTMQRDHLKAELKIRALNSEIEKLESLLDEKTGDDILPPKPDHGFFINFLARLTT